MSATFQPPPTFADPVIVNELSGRSQFNPIWLQWFLSVAQFISQANAGRLKSVIPVSSSGVYNPSQGTNNVVVFLGGDGGGGGNALATGAGQISVGGGGGAGAIVYALLTTGFSGVTISLGPGGGPGTAGSGSSFGGLIVAGGGQAGVNGSPGAAPQISQGGLGGTSTGSGLLGVGDCGDPGISPVAGFLLGGKGAGSWLGGGGQGGIAGIGGNATGFGAGGGGASNPASSGLKNGGTGSKGFAIITEYS